MKKKIAKEIRAVAKKLPKEYYQTVETYGKIVPQKVSNEANHYRRIKRLYTRGNIEGVQQYIAKRLPQRV